MALGSLSESYAFDPPLGAGKYMNQARARAWFRHFLTDGILREDAEGLALTTPFVVTNSVWPAVNVAGGECIVRSFYGRQNTAQVGSGPISQRLPESGMC